MRPIALSLFTLLTTALAADPATPVDAQATSPAPAAPTDAQPEPVPVEPTAAQPEPVPVPVQPTAPQAEPADAPAEPTAEAPSKLDSMGGPLENFYHGFRLGYTYVNRTDSSSWSRLRSPHLFVLGYEGTQVIEGGGWLDVIIVMNATVSGLNQNLLIPSGNLLVGFEVADQIQIGTGINATLGTDKLVHQVIAVGWTPKAGDFNVPVHMIVIPDVDGNWRVGMTVGVNW